MSYGVCYITANYLVSIVFSYLSVFYHTLSPPKQMKECWKDAQYEMHKSFSSSYVGKTFEKYIEEKN